MTTEPRLPRLSTPRTRTLGCLSLLFAEASALLVILEPDAPRPRWDVIATAVAALVLGLGWLFVGATGPAMSRIRTPTDAVVPPPDIPTQLPRPRGQWAFTAGAALSVTLVFALFQTLQLARGPQYQQISELRRAGAVVTDGRLTVRPDMATIKNANAQGHVTSIEYRGDLRLTVDDGHGATVVITVREATLGHWPDAGEEMKVLAVPGHPERGGYVDESGHPERYLGWVVPYSRTALLFLVIALSLVAFVRWSDNNDYGRRKMHVVRKDARDGKVPAVRVVLAAAVREERTVPGDRPGTAKVESRTFLQVTRQDKQGTNRRDTMLIPRRDVYPPVVLTQLGQAGGWLVAARRWQLIKGCTPVAFVSDDGFCVWGELDHRTSFGDFFSVRNATPTDCAPRDGEPAPAEPSSRAAVRLLPPPSWAAPSVHLVPLLLSGVAFALALPMLIDAQAWHRSELLTLLSAATGLTTAALWAYRLRAARAALPWQVRKAPQH